MNNKNLISIVVPCYNQAQYLNECLQSVLEQTCKNWECIIVNDGSPDNTEEIAKKWEEKDNRFKYLKKENGGVSSARNAGIEFAMGEWILPLDADDFIGNQYLELAEKEFDKNYTVIYCKANRFGLYNQYWNLPKYDYNEIVKRNTIFNAIFFKKNDWRKVNGYDKNLIYGFEDWDFLLSILGKNKKVLQLNYLGFYYRIKEVSRSSEVEQSAKKIKTYNYILVKHLDKIQDTLEFPILFYIYQYYESQGLIKELKRIQHSKAYRLGKFLLKPFSYIRHKILKWK